MSERYFYSYKLTKRDQDEIRRFTDNRKAEWATATILSALHLTLFFTGWDALWYVLMGFYALVAVAAGLAMAMIGLLVLPQAKVMTDPERIAKLVFERAVILDTPHVIEPPAIHHIMWMLSMSLLPLELLLLALIPALALRVFRATLLRKLGYEYLDHLNGRD